MTLLGISARLTPNPEMVEYHSRLLTMVTLWKGPCTVWWAYENDEHGGPPEVWIANIHELLAYHQRLADMKIEGIRVWVPRP